MLDGRLIHPPPNFLSFITSAIVIRNIKRKVAYSQSTFTMRAIVLCKILEVLSFLSFGIYWSTLARDVPFPGLMVMFYEGLKDRIEYGKQYIFVGM
ncbi:hypothetical protein Pyn_06524 [Prunus yedoensis var. nudiflora]|uniref:Uncharacterized protein n=1 Tax=Prunus yedoensis var. nudiflora TaxID=2094558 RepID=A0A314ZXJ3_PRUYE|nr:hypothetical protein Pyn_06524 [Prunus yedoensis var. nudiflora]